jgi:uncharacterized protein (DUF1697 family)
VPQYVAFLRGINLGYRRVKMDRLAALFEAMGFRAVATFIASGNVLFESEAADTSRLEFQIERGLAESLGYPVDTFVRTRADVAAVVALGPFPASDMVDPANIIHVGFLKTALDGDSARLLRACRTDVDEFEVGGRELYWLCRVRSSESKAWGSPAMRAIKLPTPTLRNMTMLRRLVAQYPPATG